MVANSKNQIIIKNRIKELTHLKTLYLIDLLEFYIIDQNK